MFTAIVISLIVGIGLGFGFRGLIGREKNAAIDAAKSGIESGLKKL